MNQQPKPVLVAVGPDGADAAVAFAAEEAQLVEAPMHLVHVLQMHAAEAYAGAYGAGYAYGGRYGAVLDGANSVLDTALQRARDLTDSRVPVTVERIDDGFVVARLVEHADRARLVVMEHRRLGHLRRLVTGSTVNGVAARAGVPVVSVPEGWVGTGRQLGVTVGIQDVHEAGPLLRTAFQEAAVRQARLTVLHAWWIDNGFDIVVADQSELDQREAQTRRELEPMLDARPRSSRRPRRTSRCATPQPPKHCWTPSDPPTSSCSAGDTTCCRSAATSARWPAACSPTPSAPSCSHPRSGCPRRAPTGPTSRESCTDARAPTGDGG